MATEFDELIPHLEIAHNCIISSKGDCTLALEVTKAVRFTQSSQELDAGNHTLAEAIRLFPPNTIFHWQDWYTNVRYTANPETENTSFLGQANERLYTDRPYREHKCYLFITRRFGTRKPPTSALSTLVKPSLLPDFIVRPGLLQEFIDQCEQFQRIMNDSKLIHLERLDTEGTDERPGTREILNKYFGISNGTVEDIQFEPDVWIGDTQLLLFTLSDAEHLPAQCSPSRRYERYSTDRMEFPIGFATPLGPLLDCDHVYNQYIFLDDPEEIIKKMERQRRRLTSLSGHGRDNAATRDGIDRFQQEAATTGRLPVRAHFNIIGWSNDPLSERDLKGKVSSAISSIGVIPHHETVGAPQIWWAGVPGQAGDLPINETFITFLEPALCFLIPETNDHSSESPFGIVLGDRLDGKKLRVDISDEPIKNGWAYNRNKAVFGPSGSGKSVAMNHMIRQYHEQGAHTVGIDVGGSYQMLCDVLDDSRYYV